MKKDDQKPSEARRRLLKGAFSTPTVTPVIVTLYSKSAIGNTCHTISGWQSISPGANGWASISPHAQNANCISESPEHFRKALSMNTNGTKIPQMEKTVQDLMGYSLSIYSSASIREVMTVGDSIAMSGDLGVLQHLLAMRLSMEYRGSSGPIDISYIREVWANYVSNGGRYKVNSAVYWDDLQLIEWARSVMNGGTVSQAGARPDRSFLTRWFK